MSVHAWTAYEIRARGGTAFEFFSDMYKAELGHAPNSHSIISVSRHVEYFRQFGIVMSDAFYVWRQYEEAKKAACVLPKQAVPRT